MIFDLKDATIWDPIVCNVMKNALGNFYHSKLKKNVKKIPYRDSDTEALELFLGVASREILKEEIKKEICQNFKETFAYHACRPIRVDDYYENGIVPLSPLEVQKQFRDYFSAYVSHKDIDAAIAAVPLDTRERVVHVVLDDRDFIDGCGHYLIYGGEYQNCLAIHLPGASERTRDMLKKIGKATVFVCRLPFSTVTDFDYLIPLMMADHFFRVAHERVDVNSVDYTITLKEPIPPSAIVKHYCPIKIKDPYKNQFIWNDETMKYEYP